jgi:trimeric autotransporter adhesin
MKNATQIRNIIPSLRHSHYRSLWRSRVTRLGIALALFALSTTARATDRGNSNTSDGLSALMDLTTGTFNTGLGTMTLSTLTTASNNTATGAGALTANTSGHENTADGTDALHDNTTGFDNTATGFQALASNTTASFNTAGGYQALFKNTTGASNTASGYEALYSNTTGASNTADGFSALFSNTTGNNNTASGLSALYGNTGGGDNTASGVNALFSNTTGSYNTAQGSAALATNTTGIQNTASGWGALNQNSAGNYNTADGLQALLNNSTGSNNTATGLDALFSNTIGSNNIALGAGAGGNLTTGSNNIDIGNGGVAAESNTVRIGTSGMQTATFIAGIRGVAVAGGQPVAVNVNGQLGIRASSARFKEAIKPMDKTSEAILALQPVTFRYKKELDAKAIPQFGLVAEQVAKVNPDLVTRDDQGKPFTVRYDEVNAMLLNEFLKEHSKVTEQSNINRQQEATITELRAMLAEQQKEIKTLKAGLERVSDRLDATKPAGRLATNNE